MDEKTTASQIIRHAMSMLAAIAVVIVISIEGIAYYAISEFLDQFDMSPEMVGITPLNAALQMRITSANLLLDAVSVLLFGAILLPMLYVAGRKVAVWWLGRNGRLWHLRRQRRRILSGKGSSARQIEERLNSVDAEIRRAHAMSVLTAWQVPALWYRITCNWSGCL